MVIKKISIFFLVVGLCEANNVNNALRCYYCWGCSEAKEHTKRVPQNCSEGSTFCHKRIAKTEKQKIEYYYDSFSTMKCAHNHYQYVLKMDLICASYETEEFTIRIWEACSNETADYFNIPGWCAPNARCYICRSDLCNGNETSRDLRNLDEINNTQVIEWNPVSPISCYDCNNCPEERELELRTSELCYSLDDLCYRIYDENTVALGCGTTKLFRQLCSSNCYVCRSDLCNEHKNQMRTATVVNVVEDSMLTCYYCQRCPKDQLEEKRVRRICSKNETLCYRIQTGKPGQKAKKYIKEGCGNELTYRKSCHTGNKCFICRNDLCNKDTSNMIERRSDDPAVKDHETGLACYSALPGEEPSRKEFCSSEDLFCYRSTSTTDVKLGCSGPKSWLKNCEKPEEDAKSENLACSSLMCNGEDYAYTMYERLCNNDFSDFFPTTPEWIGLTCYECNNCKGDNEKQKRKTKLCDPHDWFCYRIIKVKKVTRVKTGCGNEKKYKSLCSKEEECYICQKSLCNGQEKGSRELRNPNNLTDPEITTIQIGVSSVKCREYECKNCGPEMEKAENQSEYLKWDQCKATDGFCYRTIEDNLSGEINVRMGCTNVYEYKKLCKNNNLCYVCWEDDCNGELKNMMLIHPGEMLTRSADNKETSIVNVKGLSGSCWQCILCRRTQELTERKLEHCTKDQKFCYKNLAMLKTGMYITEGCGNHEQVHIMCQKFEQCYTCPTDTELCNDDFKKMKFLTQDNKSDVLLKSDGEKIGYKTGFLKSGILLGTIFTFISFTV